jgi:hypothetical protein
MLLHPGERIEHQGHLRRAEDGRDAAIILTNLRLVIELQPRGRWLAVEPAVTEVEAAWTHVTNAVAIRKRLGGPMLQIDTRRSSSLWRAANPDLWVRAIAEMKATRGLPPPPPPPTPHTIERQVVKVRCRHCGRLGDEVAGRCTACGAPL